MTNFEYSTSYPAAIGAQFGPGDLAYLQDHIRTFRTIHTAEIDGYQGKYYESAITMLDVFSVIMQMGLGLDPLAANIDIKPGDNTMVSFNVRNVSSVRYGPDMQLDPSYHEYMIIMMYSNIDTVDGCPGYYCVGFVPKGASADKYVSIGTTLTSEVVNHPASELELCFPASPDALRYCECFPTPAILKQMVSEAWSKVKVEDIEHETVK